MSSSATDTKTIITLKGSVEIVSEFFFTAINSILYQRGIYQPETFKREEKYGLTVLTSTEEGLLTYLNNVMGQMTNWLMTGDVQKLVLVVAGIDSGETLERWQFNVSVDDDASTTAGNTRSSSSVTTNDENNPQNISIINTNSTESSSAPTKKQNKKSLSEIHNEIQAIIRQITASVTFLPLLTEPCSFDLLVYTNQDAAVPAKWYDSDPRYIMNAQDVKLRSFTTSIHKVDTMVTYKEADEWEL